MNTAVGSGRGWVGGWGVTGIRWPYAFICNNESRSSEKRPGVTASDFIPAAETEQR